MKLLKALTKEAETDAKQSDTTESEPPKDTAANSEDDEEDEEDDERYKWSRALLYAQNAMVNSASEDAFRKESSPAD